MVWEYLTFKKIELRLHKCLGSKVKRQRRVHNRFSPGLPSLHSTLDTKCWLFPDKSKIETISKLKKSDTLLTKHNMIIMVMCYLNNYSLMQSVHYFIVALHIGKKRNLKMFLFENNSQNEECFYSILLEPCRNFWDVSTNNISIYLRWN